MHLEMSKEFLQVYLSQFNQEHIGKYWDELSEIEREILCNEVKITEFSELNKFFKRIQDDMTQSIMDIDSNIKPIPIECKGGYDKCDEQKIEEYNMNGLRAIANGEVGVILLAGGQGTRLGSTNPKGMYSVDLLSGKTLYQLQAERLVGLKRLAAKHFPNISNSSGSIPLYIMTSEATTELTENFFDENGYFGLDKENVKLFEQFMLPCLTRDGKIIMDKKYKISKAPDGNGGLYKALLKRHILDDMNEKGIKYVHIYCVDNILVKVCDPIFTGFCIEKNANCAAKVVKKVDPDEKVGVICKVNDKYQVVEYSEVSETTRNQRDSEGELMYNAGNICNHFLSSEFLNKLCREYEHELKHHVAEKKIPYIDENGIYVKPTNINGIKLEKFIFDIFPFSNASWANGNFSIWEVSREEEFSPLKNGNDAKSDNPITCRNDLMAQHFKWLEQAGAKFIQDQSNDGISLPKFEISPLVSYNGENLRELVGGKTLMEPLVIEMDKQMNILFNGVDFNTYQSRLF